MYILKFEDYINESLWKKGIERSKTGEERREDVINTNVNEFTEVDLSDELPFVFADMDLVFDDMKVFTYDEMLSAVDYISKKSDWRIMTDEEMLKYFLDTSDPCESPTGNEYHAKSDLCCDVEKYGETNIYFKNNPSIKLSFPYDEKIDGSFWLIEKNPSSNKQKPMYSISMEEWTKNFVIMFCHRHKNCKNGIRLVKDKK